VEVTGQKRRKPGIFSNVCLRDIRLLIVSTFIKYMQFTSINQCDFEVKIAIALQLTHTANHEQ